MRSTIPAMSKRVALVALAAAGGLAAGCGRLNNVFVADSPSVGQPLESLSAADVRGEYAPAAPREREWAKSHVRSADGTVLHGPLWFEDPFEDKGTGHDGYYIGWEDYVAVPYGLARFTLNWLLAPASMIVTPPWTTMESDGVLSRQLLGYDHDATVHRGWGRSCSANEPAACRHGAARACCAGAARACCSATSHCSAE
jgi:hypothetical protein